MGKFFSDKVEEGVRLVWMTYDAKEMARGMQLLTEAAGEDDADAICFLARCYMGRQYVWNGAGFPEDDVKAAKYVKDSVMKGSAIGLLCAMRCGELTPSVRKNMPFKSLKEAFDIVLEKAEGGHPFCQYAIANAYFWGDVLQLESEEEIMKRYPTEKDYDAYAYPIAAQWYERSFKGGVTNGFNNFAKIYKEGNGGIAPNPALVEQWMKIAADQGDPQQQNNYGYLLEEKGADVDSFNYYKMSADKGDPIGAYNVGCYYETGKGVDKSLTEALRYFTYSAQSGDSDGEFKVGNAYFKGLGVEPDFGKAAYWLEKSARKDNCWAYAPLGYCYLKGKGLQQSYSAALQWLNKANEESGELNDYMNSMAWNALGEVYADGLGVDEDIKTGVSFFRAAIECGSEEAQKNLSRFKKTLFGKWKRR